MNSIFIYLFFETVGVQWLVPTVRIFNDGFLGALGLGTAALAVINSLLVWGIYWGLCKFLYKHKIFIKI
jgi:hypothetical protein